MSMIQKQVAELYKVLQSQKAISRKTGLSQQAIHKMLVSEGILNERAEQINGMLESGMSKEDIANQMGITVKSVAVHLPYVRGTYCDSEKSKNATQIAKWRKKKEGRTGAVMVSTMPQKHYGCKSAFALK